MLFVIQKDVKSRKDMKINILHGNFSALCGEREYGYGDLLNDPYLIGGANRIPAFNTVSIVKIKFCAGLIPDAGLYD